MKRGGKEKAGTGEESECWESLCFALGACLAVSGFSAPRGMIQALTGPQWFFPGSHQESAVQGHSERFTEGNHTKITPVH